MREDSPRVILLDPTKQYPQYGRQEPQGTHTAPIPHHRRGHWRVLQAERYGENRGKRVWVKPSWIGEREWHYKGSTYRVCNLPDAKFPAKTEA